MSEENSAIFDSSNQPSIDQLHRECKDLLQQKQAISDKIRDFKIQLKKASRDQQYANQQTEKANTSTAALAHNSSVNMNDIEMAEIKPLGKRKSRNDDQEGIENDNEMEIDQKEHESKRQKYDSRDDRRKFTSTKGVESSKESPSPIKLTSIVASSALKKTDATENLKDDTMIELDQRETMNNEERRAQRAKKWQEENEPKNQTKPNDDKQTNNKQDTNQLQQSYSKQSETRRGGGERGDYGSRGQTNTASINSNQQITTRGVGFPARGRNLLNNMLFRHLEKAKVNLEQEKDHLQKQEQVVQKVTEKLQKDQNVIQEVQLSEIEDRLSKEIDRKRELEKKLIIANEQMRTQKDIEHMRRISNFIRTNTSPSIFWMPAKQNEKTELLAQKTKEYYQQKEEELKIKSKEKLEDRLKQFDQRMEEYNQQRKQRNLYNNAEGEQNLVQVNERMNDSLNKMDLNVSRGQSLNEGKDGDEAMICKSDQLIKQNQEKKVISNGKSDLIDELDDDDDGDLMNDIYNIN